MAHDRGFRTGVVTNAYWAESDADAEVWLRPLTGLGIEDFSVSDDALHGSEGDDSPPRRALRAAERLGLPTLSLCLEGPGPERDVRLRGRAADQLAEGLPRRPWTELTACEHEELERPNRVHLDAFGHPHVCQGISMGSIWQTPLADLVDRWDPQAHPVIGPLLRGGPAALATECGLEPEATYVEPCHLCYRMRQRLLDRFPEVLAPPQVYGEEA